MNFRYKLHGVWLAHPNQWKIEKWFYDNFVWLELPCEVRHWIFNTHCHPDKMPESAKEYVDQLHSGLVDCISIGSLMAIAFDDYDLLEVHGDLLRQGRRWPEVLDPPKEWGMRRPHEVTRDPYMGHYFACWMLNRKQFIAVTPVPWWLRRRYFSAWYRYITDQIAGKTPNPKDKAKFEKHLTKLIRWGMDTKGLWKWSFNSKCKLIKQLHHRFWVNAYSLGFWSKMSYMIDSEVIDKELLSRIPEWNLFIRMLNRNTFVSDEEIENYIPKRHFQWAREEWLDPKHYALDSDDEYPLDKQILIRLKEIK